MVVIVSAPSKEYLKNRSVLATDPAWEGWECECVEMNRANDFRALDVIARVLQLPGPV